MEPERRLVQDMSRLSAPRAALATSSDFDSNSNGMVEVALPGVSSDGRSSRPFFINRSFLTCQGKGGACVGGKGGDVSVGVFHLCFECGDLFHWHVVEPEDVGVLR